MKIFIPTSDQIVENNKKICLEEGNPFAVLDKGKIESSIHTALYPHSRLKFINIAHIADALCFYLTKAHAFVDGNKRTAVLSSISFMRVNGWDLQYPKAEENGCSAFANMVDRCASGEIDKEELVAWFELHKVNN